MKFLFVTPSLSNGGAERVVTVLANELINQGHNVDIIVYFKKEEEYFVSDKVNVIYLTQNEQNYDKTSHIKRFLLIRKIIKSEKPDYVIPFLWYVGVHICISLIGLDFKLIQTVRNNPSMVPKKKVFRGLRDFFIKRSYKILVQNEQQKLYFSSKLQKKIFVLPNPVREDLFQVEKKKKSDKFIIASAGRLTYQKNFKLLIDSVENICKENSNVILQIYGDGELKEELQSYINGKKLDKSVFLMGRTDDMKSMFESIDLYILSSDFEGMPNSLMEAMAAGVPCISTDCPTGPSDLIVDGESGLLVPVNDSIAMEKAIRKMLVLDMEKIGQSGKNYIKQNYSPDIIVKIFLKVLES